jgi:hypothetical protein
MLKMLVDVIPLRRTPSMFDPTITALETKLPTMKLTAKLLVLNGNLSVLGLITTILFLNLNAKNPTGLEKTTLVSAETVK